MSNRLSDFDWDDLRVFLAVARSGTLRAGATAMRANHTTVSRRLAALEAGIEARLFDRTRNGLKLTQLGEELMPHALRIEDDMAAASRMVAGRDARPSGTIRLSMPPALAMTRVIGDIADFCDQFPEIELHVQFTNALTDLAKREADVTIRVANDVTDDVVGRRVLRYAKAVYCSRAYAERMRDDGGQGLTWIGWGEDEGEATAAWIKGSPFPHARLKHRINEAIPQMMMAAAGIGLTYLPCGMADRHPDLVRAPYQGAPILDRSIWLLLHADLRNTSRIRAFVDFIVDRISSRREEYVAGAED